MCVCICSVVYVPGIISVNVCVKQWTAARPHYCHSPHCLKERQREAKRLLSTEEPREDGDKGPKLNKCRKAAWRASPWSYALNERERLQGYPIWVFQWGDHTDTLHASIQLNYGSVHTGAPVHAHVLCPFGMCGRVHLKLVAFLSNPLHKKRPGSISICSFTANTSTCRTPA